MHVNFQVTELLTDYCKTQNRFYSRFFIRPINLISLTAGHFSFFSFAFFSLLLILLTMIIDFHQELNKTYQRKPEKNRE